MSEHHTDDPTDEPIPADPAPAEDPQDLVEPGDTPFRLPDGEEIGEAEDPTPPTRVTRD